MKDKAFIVVSPNLEIQIKCPYSIKDTVQTVDNLKYLHTLNGKVQLKQNTKFYQIQGQMGASGRKYCYLFIFTNHGHLTEKIDFNPAFWEDMLLKLDWFWHNGFFPELLYQTIKQKQEESQHKLLSPTSTTDVKELPSSKSKKSSIQFLSSVPVSHSVAVPSPCRDSAKAMLFCVNKSFPK